MKEENKIIKLLKSGHVVMLYQKADTDKYPIHDCGVLSSDRIRIIYPDGKTEWASLQTNPPSMRYVFGEIPCWALDDRNEALTFKNGKQAFEVMCEYDKGENWKPAILVDSWKE